MLRSKDYCSKITVQKIFKNFANSVSSYQDTRRTITHVYRVFFVITVFLFDTRSCCDCLACRSWWRRWRLRLSVQHWTAPTTHTAPSQTTQMCGCLEGDTSTRTSSAKTNMLNTTSTVTCRTNWVSALHDHVCVSRSRKGFIELGVESVLQQITVLI